MLNDNVTGELIAGQTHYTKRLSVVSICGGSYRYDTDDISKVTCPFCIESLLRRQGPWPDTAQREELEKTRKAVWVELHLT
jgi:hypothetical protein